MVKALYTDTHFPGVFVAIHSHTLYTYFVYGQIHFVLIFCILDLELDLHYTKML